MKLAFKQNDIINYLIESFTNIEGLEKMVMKENGFELIKEKYSTQIKKILNIIESQEDIAENLRCINNELKSVFDTDSNSLKFYNDKIRELDQSIDEIDDSINEDFLDQLFSDFNSKSINFNDNKIEIDISEIVNDVL